MRHRPRPWLRSSRPAAPSAKIPIFGFHRPAPARKRCRGAEQHFACLPDDIESIAQFARGRSGFRLRVEGRAFGAQRPWPISCKSIRDAVAQRGEDCDMLRDAAISRSGRAIAGSRRPARAQTVKIKVAEVLRTQFYMPMYVALGKGYVKEEGLESNHQRRRRRSRRRADLSGGCDFGLAGPEVPMYIYNGEIPDKPAMFCAPPAPTDISSSQRRRSRSSNGRCSTARRSWTASRQHAQAVPRVLLNKKGVNEATIKDLVTNVAPAAREGACSRAARFRALPRAAPHQARECRPRPCDHLHRQGGWPRGVHVFFAKKSWLAKNPETAQKWTNAIAKARPG